MVDDRIGKFPDFSHFTEEELKKVVAIHGMTPAEVGKIPVMDNIFYEGHVGFYDADKVEEAKKIGEKYSKMRKERDLDISGKTS